MKVLRFTLPTLIPRDPLLIKVSAVVLSVHFVIVGIVVYFFTGERREVQHGRVILKPGG
jgi:hypothetical protein